LDLALLIDAEHNRGLGRVEVQPDDIVDLLNEQRVIAQLETVSPVGLELKGLPDPTNRRLRQPGPLSHLRPRPVRRVRRRRFQRRDHNVLDLIERDRGQATQPVIIGQAVKAMLHKPSPPLPDRHLRAPQLSRHGLVVHTIRAGQHDPGTQHQRLCRLPTPRPAHQLLALLAGQHQLGLGSSRPCHTPILLLTKRTKGARH